MKIKYAIAASVLLSVSAFAQKDELKALKKLDDLKTPPTAAQLKEYKDLFAAFEAKEGSATEEQKRDFYYYRGTYLLFIDALLNPMNAPATISKGMDDVNKVLEIEKRTGKKKYTDELKQSLPQLKEQIAQMASQLAQQKMYKEAGMAFGLAYKVDPKDPTNLYNAAAMAVNGQDYDSALVHYLELDKMGYTGEGTVYTAKNVKTGQIEGFPNEELMKSAVLTKQYSNPKIEKLPSVRGEIVKNIALIYNQKGETEKAKQAFLSARKANPDDINLIISEADMYMREKNMDMYKKLINEAVQKKPNDADLYYNLGVVTMPTDKKEAQQFFEKALAINPNYTNANINLGVMMLDGEEKIVDEMNNPKTSDKRYNELKKQRDDLYKKALGYFDKAHKADPENQYVISMMANIYQGLDMEAQAKAMRAKVKN